MGNAFFYLFWIVATLIFYQVFKRIERHFWRWLLSLIVGYLVVLVGGFLIAALA